MRFTPLLLTLLCLATSCPALAQQPERPREHPPTMRGRLAEPIDTDAAEQPFISVLRTWSDTAGIQLVIDWRGLDDAGIDRDTPVTLELRGISAGRTLELILDAVQPEPIGDEEVFAQAFDRYVEVLTKATANRRPELTAYDIRDLLVPEHDNFRNAPRFDLDNVLGSDNDTASIFVDDDELEELETPRERADRIIELIRTHIEPDAWEENGGDVASIRYFQGTLVVNAPGYIQAKIPFLGRPLRD